MGLGKREDSKKARSEQSFDEQMPVLSASNITESDNSGVFWPVDLLPARCPQARIMVWRYDTMVTRGLGKAADKNGLYAHGQTLLYALSREREERRPIIFVAHSLGGILVKEMLAYADMSKKTEFVDIIMDTSALVFMGTPHRGSDVAQIGDIARRIANVLRLDTSPAMLDSLGLRNDDLVRSQQTFARIWDERRFDVKTFQESKGIGGVNFGFLSEHVSHSSITAT
jgi:predicted alpha/beta hydrolase family esterase